jgi:aspartate aminotransferase
MTISRAIAGQIQCASWIRRMFEAGVQLRRERGPENVFDFSIGNPDVEPPAAVLDALRRIVAENRPHSHGYMPNAGYPEVRNSVARSLAARTGIAFTGDDLLMTNGAAGAINIVLKAILDPGDEVIILSPYFPEYRSYIENHAGRVVTVDTAGNFQPDPARIAAAITPRTRALILNSPNNPTGVIYSEAVLRELNRVLSDPVLVICDEPYRPLTFDGACTPEAVRIFDRVVIAWSWSKAMAIPGERIGYLAIPPHLGGAADLRAACTVANRILGYINAPAIWQWVVGAVPDATVDVMQFQERRDLLCDALTEMGYDAPRPQGGFYVFPKTPDPNDIGFIAHLQEQGILAVPGTGFGRPGYMRLSLTIPLESIRRSLPGFERAFLAATCSTLSPGERSSFCLPR